MHNTTACIINNRQINVDCASPEKKKKKKKNLYITELKMKVRTASLCYIY